MYLIVISYTAQFKRLLINMFCSFNRDIIILHCSALIEVAISSVLALLIMPPTGKFSINTCQVRSLSDWYTLLHNPSPNYERQIHCTQEAVYPL